MSRYEEQSGKTIDEDVKISVLIGGMQNAKVKDHLELNAGRLDTYRQLRSEILNFAVARRTRAHTNEDDPVTIGALRSKGDKGGKGKQDAYEQNRNYNANNWNYDKQPDTKGWYGNQKQGAGKWNNNTGSRKGTCDAWTKGSWPSDPNLYSAKCDNWDGETTRPISAIGSEKVGPLGR